MSDFSFFNFCTFVNFFKYKKMIGIKKLLNNLRVIFYDFITLQKSSFFPWEINSNFYEL